MDSSRSRAQTEPDVFPTTGVSVRRNSSYDPGRSTGHECIEPSPESVGALASLLGLSLDKTENQNLSWIVRDCLLTLADNGWSSLVVARADSRDLIFQHKISGEKRSGHDIVSIYSAFAQRVRFEQTRLDTLRANPRFRIRELVLDRLRRAQHPRNMATPRTIESILNILGIDIFSEFFLAKIVREELDCAYFSMKQAGGPEYVTEDSCFSVEQLETRIAIERMRFVKQTTQVKLLFCVNCRKNLSDGACATCGDCLCAYCHGELHSKGNRRDHLFVFLDQTVCSQCTVRGADIRCADCADLFCRDCLVSTHQKGKHTKHCIQIAVPIFCLNCEISEAGVMCLECCDALCISCAMRLHNTGSRKQHNLYGIQSYAYPNKLFASNVDAIMRVLDKVLVPPKRSPWMLFFDSKTGPYWYSFLSHKTVPTTMESMDLQPEHDVEIYRKSESLALEKAKQRASFDIPPHFQLKLLNKTT